MGSRIYLTNIDSDVSGYKLALVDMRNPNLPTSPATAVTNATNSGTSIQMTLTPAGTAAKWITRKLSAAVTIGANAAERVFFNLSAKEDAGATNSAVQVKLAQYTTSEQTPFLTESYAAIGVVTELGTTTAPNEWVSSVPGSWTSSSVAFSATNRLVILPYVVNVGTMAAGSVTLSFDGPVSSAGDSYVELFEVLQVSQAQVGSASTPGVKGVGVSYFAGIADKLQAANPQAGAATTGTGAGGWLSDETTVLAAINEANNQKALE